MDKASVRDRWQYFPVSLHTNQFKLPEAHVICSKKWAKSSSTFDVIKQPVPSCNRRSFTAQGQVFHFWLKWLCRMIGTALFVASEKSWAQVFLIEVIGPTSEWQQAVVIFQFPFFRFDMMRNFYFSLGLLMGADTDICLYPSFTKVRWQNSMAHYQDWQAEGI